MDNKVHVHVTGTDPERVQRARTLIRDALTASGWESMGHRPRRVLHVVRNDEGRAS